MNEQKMPDGQARPWEADVGMRITTGSSDVRSRKSLFSNYNQMGGATLATSASDTLVACA